MVGQEIARVGNMRLVGRVVSDKMQKTVVVRVDHKVWHTKYHRWFVRRKRFFAHDHDESCTPGDIVAIEQCEKLARHKSFEVAEIIKPINPALPKDVAQTIAAIKASASNAAATAPAATVATAAAASRAAETAKAAAIAL